jgi:hypothetical protein
MAPLTADRHTANGNKFIISLACSNVVDYWQGVVPIFLCLNDVHFDFFFCWTWAENDRSLSWMGPVMEALSKSYQKYEMGAGSSRSEEEHHE